MSRKPNAHRTSRVVVSPSAEVVTYLEELARIGIHGKTTAEVAKTLIGYEIERLIREGVIKMRGR